MNQRNTIDRTQQTVPDVRIAPPLERMKIYARNLAVSIETNNQTLIHNNQTWLRKAMDEYDNSRLGTADLPF